MRFTGHYVYRLYDASGQLLYVGRSRNLPQRQGEHRRNQFWFSRVATYRLTGPFRTAEDAAVAERTAIRTERPRHNIQHGSPMTPEDWAAEAAFLRDRNRHRYGRRVA